LRCVKKEHSHPKNRFDDDRLPMDRRIVHEEHHRSLVVISISSYLKEQLVDEVLKHGSIDHLL
jgi:hypothetical protein